MLSLQVRSPRTEDEVWKALYAFFGDEGLGMNAQRHDGSVEFRASPASGFVTAHVHSEQQGTIVDLETRDWDGRVKEFAAKIS